MTYTTCGINIHNNAAGALRMAHLGLDQVRLNESSKIQPALRDLARYRLTNLTDPGPDKERKSLWGNTILTRDQYPSLGDVCLQAADRSAPYRIAPDRTIVCEIIDHPIGVIAGITLHNHYIGEMNDNPKVDRVKEAHEYGQVLADVLRLVQARADHIVVNGDINVRDSVPTPGWDTVWEVMRRMGLEIKNITPIDGLGYSKSLRLLNFYTLPKDRFGTDHDGFGASFGDR